MLHLKQLIVIVGPTASGKTSLAIQLANHFDAEIIGADSRQFYKHLDIGTAKPTAEEQSEVKHHFIDFLEPDSEYNVGQYETDVIAFLADYFKSRDVAILVGGSGLFIKSIMEGMDEMPDIPKEIRERWQAHFEQYGLESIASELTKNDPISAESIDLKNPQRVLRALEVLSATGESITTFHRKERKARPFHIEGVLLDPDREWLYQRINHRVDQMMKAGFLDEARRLLPYRSFNSLNTVGYKELFAHLDGEMKLDEAVDKIKQHTRNFAKRQFTWFRRQSGFKKFDQVNSEQIRKHLEKTLIVS